MSTPPAPESALAVQVGGDHYKVWPIQPVEFAEINDLGACQASIVKYLMRYQWKGGAEDLRKAAHYCDLMAELAGDREIFWHRRSISLRADSGLRVMTLDHFAHHNGLLLSVTSILQKVLIKPDAAQLRAARLEILELACALETQADS